MTKFTKFSGLGLYIHVPFCESKCGYCKFYSVKYNKITADLWKSAVVRNLAQYDRLRFDTIFFGGGTPSLLYREIAQILPDIRVTSDAEITVEANPDDITPDMLGLLLESGVNRLSVGVQSLDDDILRSLGRRHDSETAVNAVESAKKAGFDNISVDIMLGLPGQNPQKADEVHKLPISHISAYMFESEHRLPDDDTADLYLSAVGTFEAGGFAQYEISNFARDGRECKHNLGYWNPRDWEYVGIAPSANGYFGGKRYAVKSDVADFVDSPIQSVTVTDENPCDFEEFAMLRLRLTRGLRKADCTSREWESLCDRAKSIPKTYIKAGSESLSLTPRGFLIANRIIGELLG
ncbi:MAG: radical SAM family heme chaperone HemW [Oscillospiraceae bacterium]|nr:radical SAM family heme chaperone HemW [Oscillospiraceae bacterium]